MALQACVLIHKNVPRERIYDIPMLSNKHIILELLSGRHERLSDIFFSNMSTCKSDSKLTYLLEKEITHMTR